MASERKTSGWLVFGGWAIVAVVFALTVEVGADWYFNGHLRLCVPEDSIEPPKGFYEPPLNASDLLTPPYWCALRVIRACKPEDWSMPPAGRYLPPAKLQDLLRPTYWCCLREVLFQGKAIAACVKSQDAMSNGIAAPNPLSRIDGDAFDTEFDTKTYAGMNRFWSDDFISNFFANAMALIYRWLSETFNPWFKESFVPGWNEFFATDDPAVQSRRIIIPTLAGFLFAAFIGVLVKATWDWGHDK